jgi:hypothetical protein
MPDNTLHFPFQPLKVWLDSHVTRPIAQMLSYKDRAMFFRAQSSGHLTLMAADRLATSLGVHPRDIWDNWDAVSAGESNPKPTEYDTLAKRVLKAAIAQTIEDGRPTLVYRKRKAREGYSRQTYCQEYIFENDVKAKAGCIRVGEEYHVYIFPLEVPATETGWPRAER